MIWKRIIATTCLVFLTLTACNLPIPVDDAGTNQDPTQAIRTRPAENAASSGAAQTALANAVASTLAAMATDTPESTFTPSLTTTSSFTPPAVFTLTPEVPMVIVSVQTNCRSGPGKAFDILGILNVGQSAEVVGRSVYNDNWIIKLPSNPAITCWLWGQYATVVGNSTGLPAFTPPASPTPEALFNVVYFSTESCAWGTYAIKFLITNTGSLTWESNKVVVTDLVTSETKEASWDNFPNYNDTGCALVSADLNLDAGKAGYTTALAFSSNPAGHNVMAVIRACSLDGLAGTCLDKSITFTP